MNDADFAELYAQARAGDGDAVERLLESFEDDVRFLVRRRLPRALRSQFDSMDFVQAVWQSVFTGRERQPDGEAVAFEGAGHFRGFLAGVARNKILQEYRRRTRTKKYALGREEPLYVRRGARQEPRAVASGDPTPSQQVQAADRLDQLKAGRSPAEAEVVELRKEGLTFEEIAAQTGLHERTVRRVIGTIRQRLEARRWQ